MRSLIIACLAALLAACIPCVVLGQNQNPAIEVTAEGSAAVIGGDLGRAEDDAVIVAKRNAVEQAVGVFVKSEALGKDYQVVEQTILTKSNGFVASWEKIEGSRKVEKEGNDSLLSIKIRAKVKAIELVDALSDAEAIYNAMQRPKVMVVINEDNMGQKSDDFPASGAAIMRALQERNFDLVDPEIVKKVIAREAARATFERDDPKAAAVIAQDQGAEILVLGKAKATKQDLPDFAGSAIKAASANLTVKLVYADTGEVLYTSVPVEGRGKSTSDASEAGRDALNKAGEALMGADGKRFASQVLARWASEIQNGRTLRLIANGVSYSDVTALQKVLKEFSGFQGFVGQLKYQGKTATIELRTKMSPDQFRERLSETKVGKKKIEVEMASGAVTAVSLK